MICKNCGNEHIDGIMLSCPNCGADICNSCAENTDRICPYCYSTLEFKS